MQLVKIKYVKSPNLLESKIQVVDKKLHEFNNELLRDFGGNFKMIGKLSVGDQIREIHIRSRNILYYERYNSAIDEGCDAEDSIFTGHIYTFSTPEFNVVSRSRYANGCHFKHQIIDYKGNNCYIPSEVYCFIECINYLTESD